MSIDKIKSIVLRSAIYVPDDCEGIRIEYCDDEMFYGIGEESGEEYGFEYEEVDLEKDMFYELKLVDINE